MIADKIRDSVKRLTSHPGFTRWVSSEPLSDEDVVVVNNSFVFREVKTTKSDKFLALFELKSGPIRAKIASAPRQNLDFKRFSGPGVSALDSQELDAAVDEQLQGLGFLVFLLIAEVQDTVTLEETIDHQDLEKAVWDPAVQDATLQAGVLTTGQVHDEELVWQIVEQGYQAAEAVIPDGLRDAIGTALDKLQERAEAVVQVPSSVGAVSDSGITDSILCVLREQREQYSTALDRYDGSGGGDVSALNEVLRIAYNFASDATGFLRLIVSICDLKPVVLWGTITEHYALSEAYRSLPWTRSKNKPTLRNYQSNIGDARNSAFHNLFPFRKTLRIELPSEAIGEPTLRIFSEHTKKGSNQLTYRDKELVDVLVEFTRARDRQVPSGFWQRNLDVMDGTIELFAATNEFVKALHAAKT